MSPEQLQVQAAIAIIVPTIIEWMKKAHWLPWIRQETDTLNRVLSALIATSTAAGFSFAHSGSPFDGGSITISYPGIVQFIAFAVTQYGGQTYWYQKMMKK